ncbi:ATP-binding protein [Actinotalea sp. K2]|uniref:AAA family ATPase n=1 Tax=Actinotalea sp. K2 TaxID=2939438 RepID=UPI002017FBC7|nr:ATP-binding protein [Actinotalea sp. K2]MCL3863038.1 AAA family ATPase [Actinotalea sp. K2]
MTGQGARLLWVEIRGFRAFGTEPRRLELDAPLIVVHAGNSQGKTSLAEALEFLITGRSSRRDLLGGAKAEYDDSLRNAHLPDGDLDVYIEAGVAAPGGVVHKVRRELVQDFGHGTECASRLLIDGLPAEDLAPVGLPMSDPPVRAPVLLQHILRHVLATEPKQRVGYFKALLSLTDLDLLRERVTAARTTLEREAPGATLTEVATLLQTPAAPAADALQTVADCTPDAEAIAAAVDVALLTAGSALLGTPSASRPELQTALEAVIAEQNEETFPLRAFTAGTVVDAPSPPDLRPYAHVLAQADRDAARLAPLLAAALAVEDLAKLDHPMDCPICATPGALTPARMATLRDQLRRTTAVDTAAIAADGVVQRARQVLDHLLSALPGAVPLAGAWSPEQLATAAAQLRHLGVDDTLAEPAQATAASLASATGDVRTAAKAATEMLDHTALDIKTRNDPSGDLAGSYTALTEAVEELQRASRDHHETLQTLRAVVEPAVRHRAAGSGLTELRNLVAHVEQLVHDLVAEAGRKRTITRLKAAEQALRKGAGRVLDARFEQMSKAIDEWWATIRPEELVGFGGVRRRAGGSRFVNLDATLRSAPTEKVVVRDALGIFSDSQLNALGLAIFLARAELLGSSVIVLDDPIPGSDADHRLSFVQNTLDRLLDAGAQVVLTTFDTRLAELAQSNHNYRDMLVFELSLADPLAGTEAVQTSDTFSRLMQDAGVHLKAGTMRGRKDACNSYRSAAERLAKQIIATGRTCEGRPSTVAEVDAEAPLLGDLVPLVCHYAADEAEKGRWRSFGQVLNPGSHDDGTPSNGDLAQIKGNLSRIAKNHAKHWPGGLLL